MIDNRFFNNPICKLGTFEVSNGRATAMQDKASDIDFSIAKYEPEYLRMLMGSEVYEEYKSTIDDIKWEPLKTRLVDDVNFISPIANYVYYKHRRITAVSSDGVKDYTTKTDNTDGVGISSRLVTAWNDMVDLTQPICQYIYNSIITSNAPAIETVAQWDYSGWEILLKKQSRLFT